MAINRSLWVLTLALITQLILGCSVNNKNENNEKMKLAWLDKIEKLQIAIEANFKTERLPSNLLGAATKDEIERVEGGIQTQIPIQLKEFFLNESKYAYMNWHIPKDYIMPKQIEHITGGGIELGLDNLVEMDRA